MSHNKNNSHKDAKKTAYKEEQSEDKNHKPAQPGLAETADGRKERSLIGAAHREGRDEDKKMESLQKASELHEKRTGEPLPEAVEKLEGEEEEKHRGSKKDSEKSHTDKDEQHLANQERSLIGAAHRKNRDQEGKDESLVKASEIHQELTGEPLPEAVEKGVVDEHLGEKIDKEVAKEEAHLANQERAFIAAAHRKGRDEEAKEESLAKASKIHEERTGEPLPEAVEKGVVDEERERKRAHEEESREEDSSKRQKLDSAVEQPGLAATSDGRQERAFIAAAHREGRSEEAKLDSLRKANEIHEKRTGAPLGEAVERGLAAEQ